MNFSTSDQVNLKRSILKGSGFVRDENVNASRGNEKNRRLTSHQFGNRKGKQLNER